MKNCTPIIALMPSEDNPAVGPFHVLVNGKPVRLYPGTGNAVTLDVLGEGVRWCGDSIGLSTQPLITVLDDAGNWTEAPPQVLMRHQVWERLDVDSKRRVLSGLGAEA